MNENKCKVSIFRDGSKVVVWMQPDLSTLRKGNTGYRFEHEFGSEGVAEAMTLRISDDFYDAIEAVRREEYAAGWRDKSRKLAARDYFYRTLTLLGDLANRKR